MYCSKESPPPGYLSDDTSGIENSPGACSVLGGGSSGMCHAYLHRVVFIVLLCASWFTNYVTSIHTG